MLRWQIWLGAAIGLVAAAMLLALTSRGPGKVAASGPIISEVEGHLRELVIQYDPAAKSFVASTYKDFLGALEPDMLVHVLCSNRAAFDDLCSVVGPVRCRLNPILADHPMTTWSRDRWVALAPATSTSKTTLLSPRTESAAGVWDARAGDEFAGDDIARALPLTASARRSHLYFDGGDFFADSENVLVCPRLISRNLQHSVGSVNELTATLASEFKRHVVLLNEAPDHHAAMFMVSPGRKIMFVASPALGRQFLPTNPPANSRDFVDLPGGADFSAETQRLFDAVANQCSSLGYRVIRLPVIPAQDGRTFLTYVNVIMDQQASRRIVYLPAYRGFETMNQAARAAWENLGFEVRSIDCTEVCQRYGCIHCLVNVLSRS